MAKGRTRRTVPLTEPLMRALTALPHIRRGRVVCNPDGMPVTEGETKHVLRHTLATHAAQLGVNPWTLQRWLGHKRIDETMRYVHLAEEHHRPIPEPVIAAAGALTDPDQRILAMLAARHGAVTDEHAATRM